MTVQAWFGEVALTRVLLQRGVGAIYVLAFWNALNQFRPLLGERGLLPVPAFLARVPFREAPSLFYLGYSDRRLAWVGGAGLGLSLLTVTGVADSGPVWLSLAIWLSLYLLYLSIVNVGQTFYAFGWESMLLEAGFFVAFLGPSTASPSYVPVLALRWMLFRVELGAGLIKLRGDPCWRDLTCLYYHHETQPLPNPLSLYFHHGPKALHRASVAFSHFVQLVAPFGLFGPQWLSAVAGCFLVLQQLVLILSGNYAWLNWLTVVLGFSAFSDEMLSVLLPAFVTPLAPRPVAFEWLLYGLGIVTVLLSVRPVLNLLSKNQAMNQAYNPLHLVGTYGAFGSVTRARHEVIVEGTASPSLEGAEWREYEFKAKPGNPRRRAPQWAPYHLRLDWLMWFLPLRVMITPSRLLSRGHPLWFTRFVQKLLLNDAATLALLRENPFPDAAPRYVRASFYAYELASPSESLKAGVHWRRRYLGEYLAPRALEETSL
ncbi:MAG: lipase maturation factor family protein [Myxococcales bacterium]|nr:MAG: lipase maturation factor family protein [Myxococcales bacterium]